MSTQAMLETHPAKSTFDAPELAAAIDRLSACVATCSICADACLHEDDVDGLRRCIQVDLNCADVCSATLRTISRPGPDGGTWAAMLETCVKACEECASECESHEHDHCRQCAEACRACAEACRSLLAAAS